jgi:Holliday junction resolvase RusA-like endonuclease
MKITLLGKPMSTNSIYKTVCRGNFPSRYLALNGKTLKESYMWQAKSQWKEKPLTEKLHVTVRTYHDNKRKNDWDNFHKLSMDAMTGIVYEDDSQIHSAVILKLYDKKNPRIEIEIEKYNN